VHIIFGQKALFMQKNCIFCNTMQHKFVKMTIILVYVAENKGILNKYDKNY